MKATDIKITYNEYYKTVEGNNLKKAEESVKLWHSYDGSFFWRGYNIASARRAWEKKNNYDIKFELNGNEWQMVITGSMSAKHAYVTRKLYKNGEKVTLRELNSEIEKAREKLEGIE